mmetsp:Transcript_1731/g.3667  ORF Transcript_1731/g.3667 Transcript_1731/m.3667 type:complete len:227 (-) Transcript_1731:686-1366(-)
MGNPQARDSVLPRPRSLPHQDGGGPVRCPGRQRGDALDAQGNEVCPAVHGRHPLVGEKAQHGVGGAGGGAGCAEAVDVPGEHLRGIGGHPAAASCRILHVRDGGQELDVRDEEDARSFDGAGCLHGGRYSPTAVGDERHAGEDPEVPGRVPGDQTSRLPPLLLRLLRRPARDPRPGPRPAGSPAAPQEVLRCHQEPQDGSQQETDGGGRNELAGRRVRPLPVAGAD